MHAGFVILAALCFYGALAAILMHKKWAGSALSYYLFTILGDVVLTLYSTPL